MAMNYGSRDGMGGYQSDGGTVQAGVGIFFQQEADGSVYVKTIVNGGSAERDGAVRVGDMILAVDDREVVGEPLSTLRGLILGPQGSRVRLSFERREAADIRQFECTLVRGTAEYLNGLGGGRGMEDDVDEARLQLRQALAHCQQDREELDRLRKMLQQERESAQRLEREIEELQQSNSEELARLNDTLRKAEQSRRDGELQLHPLEQREADLADELQRQKEKERLRKEYIEELKKRHEEEKNRLETIHLKEQAGRRDDQVLRLTAETALSRVQAELNKLLAHKESRKEREEEYQARMDEENRRMKELVQVTDQLRLQLRDMESRVGQSSTLLDAAPYQPPEPRDIGAADDLFLA